MLQSTAANLGISTPLHELPAPISGWRRLAADMASVGGSSIVCQAIAVLNSLVLRAALTPVQMGVWQGLKLLLGYSNYTNLGVSKGAARILTIAVGSGNTAQAQRALNLAFAVNTATSLLYGFAIAAAVFGWRGRRGGMAADDWLIGFLALIALVVVQRHLTFQMTMLRSKQLLALTSRAVVLEAALGLLLAGFGAWRWGLPGLYASAVLTLLATLAFLRLCGASSAAFAWDYSEIQRLVLIGGPTLLGAVAGALLQSLDKLLGRSKNVNCRQTPTSPSQLIDPSFSGRRLG